MQELQPLEARLTKLGDIIKMKLTVPSFQRLYSWEEPQWASLVEDLRSTQQDGKRLFLGLCVLVKTNDGYEIIDGQQRLTTLALLLSVFGAKEALVSKLDGQKTCFIMPQSPDDLWMTKVLSGEPCGPPRRASQKLLTNAAVFFKEKRDLLDLEQVKESQLILYCAGEMQGATSLFERVNLRGKGISRIELVKNRLFDWAGRLKGASSRHALETEIKARFSNLFSQLNPHPEEDTVDLDAFLRVHWILFDDGKTFTTDFADILAKLDDYVKRNLETSTDSDDAIAIAVRSYIVSLDTTCVHWRRVTSPTTNPSRNKELTETLASVRRLNRDANYTPLLVAALSTWEESGASLKFSRFIEISAFRQALVADQSNYRRTVKWRVAKAIFRANVGSDEATRMLFWNVCPWWDRSEADQREPGRKHSKLSDAEFAVTAFSDTMAYSKYGYLFKYFFWEYGRRLPDDKRWPEAKEDISVQTNDQWRLKFKTLEIEHIFPQTPKDRDSAIVKARSKKMEPYLNHWGNLTLLTRTDNGSLQNSDFSVKLSAVLKNNSNLSFNKVLSNKEYRGNIVGAAWGPNNCVKRCAQLSSFADERWGQKALKDYVLGDYVDALC